MLSALATVRGLGPTFRFPIAHLCSPASGFEVLAHRVWLVFPVCTVERPPSGCLCVFCGDVTALVFGLFVKCVICLLLSSRHSRGSRFQASDIDMFSLLLYEFF